LPYEKVGNKEPVCIADEVPFEIPDSWEWVTLKQIAVTELGKTLDKAKNTGSLHPYLCSINIHWTGVDLSTVKQARFEEAEFDKYRLQRGDLLVCEGGDVGRAAIWYFDDVEMFYQNALHRIRFYGKIVPEFFKLSLECYKGNKILDEYSKGMTIKHLVQSSLNTIYFPLPPLAEQRRIVEAVSRITPYLENYNQVETQLLSLDSSFPDQLKKSILQLAVQGKLVPQDPNDEPASVLLERIREEKEQLIKAGKIKRDKHEAVIYRRDNSHYENVDGIEHCIDDEIPFEIPESWEWVRFCDVIDVRDGTHDTPKYVPIGIPLVTSKNLVDGRIDFSTAKLISQEDANAINLRSAVEENDILFAMIGTIGNPVLVKDSRNFCIKNVALFKPISGRNFDMEYFLLFLQGEQFAMKSLASGGVQSFVSLKFLRAYWLPLPPLSEQHRIVNKVKLLMRACDNL